MWHSAPVNTKLACLCIYVLVCNLSWTEPHVYLDMEALISIFYDACFLCDFYAFITSFYIYHWQTTLELPIINILLLPSLPANSWIFKTKMWLSDLQFLQNWFSFLNYQLYNIFNCNNKQNLCWIGNNCWISSACEFNMQ